MEYPNCIVHDFITIGVHAALRVLVFGQSILHEYFIFDF